MTFLKKTINLRRTIFFAVCQNPSIGCQTSHQYSPQSATLKEVTVSKRQGTVKSDLFELLWLKWHERIFSNPKKRTKTAVLLRGVMFRKLFFQTICFRRNILVETIWNIKTVTQNLILEGWTLQLADYFYPCIQIKNTIIWTCRASTLVISFALQGGNLIIGQTFFRSIDPFLGSKLNKKYVSPTTQNYSLK